MGGGRVDGTTCQALVTERELPVLSLEESLTEKGERENEEEMISKIYTFTSSVAGQGKGKRENEEQINSYRKVTQATSLVRIANDDRILEGESNDPERADFLLGNLGLEG